MHKCLSVCALLTMETAILLVKTEVIVAHQKFLTNTIIKSIKYVHPLKHKYFDFRFLLF